MSAPDYSVDGMAKQLVELRERNARLVEIVGSHVEALADEKALTAELVKVLEAFQSAFSIDAAWTDERVLRAFEAAGRDCARVLARAKGGTR